MTTGQEEIEPHESLVGDYKVIKTDGKFRLRLNPLGQSESPDVKDLIFEEDEVTEAGNTLSIAFDRNRSEGTSTYWIGNALKVEVTGGKDANCKIYRLKKDKEIVGVPCEVRSKQELKETYMLVFGHRTR